MTDEEVLPIDAVPVCRYRQCIVTVDPEWQNRLHWSAPWEFDTWPFDNWLEVGDDSPITALRAEPFMLLVAKGREWWAWTGEPGLHDRLYRVDRSLTGRLRSAWSEWRRVAAYWT